MYKNLKIGVIIPAYNEEKFIGEVIERIPEYIDRIYVVDDGSRDRTGEIASKLAEKSSGRVQICRHLKNGGVGKAISTGYRACLVDLMDISVVMAGDNQMNPAQLPKLLDPIVEGKADYTVGDRLSTLGHMKGMSYWRRFGNWTLRWLTRIAAGNLDICDPQNGYTAIAYRSLARLDLDHIYPRYGYCNDLLVKLSVTGSRIRQIRMPAVYGNEKSKIKYWHYIPTVSLLLLRDFLWRIKVQLFDQNKIKPVKITGIREK
jgi:glycosyltransferase involved in cell wall biosynthesis